MNNDHNLLIKYKLAFDDFENKYVKNIYNNYTNYKEHRGYLINLENYEGIKNKVLSYYNNSSGISASKIIQSIKKLKGIKKKNSTYLINMLSNYNKYIIINSSLWELLGDVGNLYAKFLYYIDKDLIVFSLDDKIQLKFVDYYHNNIISIHNFYQQYNSNCYSRLISNYENIKKIYKEIKEYYDFEKEIICHLNNNKTTKNTKDLCYLIDEKWINDWMEKINYKEMKNYFFEKKNEKLIKDKIIFFEEENKKKQINLSKIITKNFRTDKELKNYLENNSLAIVNFDFIYCFGEIERHSFYYYVSNNYISLEIDNKFINFKSNNNLISIQNNKNLAEDKSDLFFQIYFQPIIKYFYLNEEIITRIFYQHNRIYNENNEVYYINKKSMDKYKEFFEYSELNETLKSKEFNQIKYQKIKNNCQFVIDLIKNYNKKYHEKMSKKVSSLKFKFDEDYYQIPYKLYDSGSKKIKYFDDFEILDKEIISDLESIGIIKKEFLIKGEYVAGDNKILFCFNEYDKNYIQINNYDSKYKKFITEVLIEDIYGSSIGYFKKEGINYFLTRIIGNKIYYNDNNPIYYCYEITNKETQNEKGFETPIPMDTDNGINNQYSNNVIYLLLSYALFLLDLQKKISESKIIYENKGNIQTYKYYLVNKDIISEFINSFWDETINGIIQKYNLYFSNDIDDNKLKSILVDRDLETIIKKVNEQKDLFKEKIKNMGFYNIQTQSIYENNELIYYPKDLMFLDESLLSKFIKFLEIKEDSFSNKRIEINLRLNYGDIVFKNDQYFFLENKLYLIYIYSIEKNPNIIKGINFKLDIILSFSEKNDFIKYFDTLLSINIRAGCNNLAKDYEEMYNLKIHLINKNCGNDNENQLNKNLTAFAKLYKEYLNIKKIMCLSIDDSKRLNRAEEKYYLINKKYINHFEDITNFNTIKNILDRYINFYNQFDERKNDFVNEIKKYLSLEITNKLSSLKNNLIFTQFNSDIYKLESSCYTKTNYYYYDNFLIINEEIKKILGMFIKLNSLTFPFIESVDCIFDNKKIFVVLKEYIILGHLEQVQQTEQIIVDYLIIPKYENHLENIVKNIKNKGYIFIYPFLEKGEIDYKYNYGVGNYFYIQGNIYNVFKQKQINNMGIIQKPKISETSENLKKLILLYMELETNITIENSNKLAEEVYLVDPKILLNSCFNDIRSLISNNKDLYEFLSKFNSSKDGLDPKQLEKVIAKIDYGILKKLDDKYNNIILKDIKPNEYKVTLKKRKEVSTYKNLIMLNKKRFENKYVEFGLFNLPKAFTTKTFDNDDIIIDENQEYIIIGRISENYFNLKYIIYFPDNKDLKDNLKIIKNIGIEQYLQNQAVFNRENRDDTISPIFSELKEIGACYKIEPGVNDYSNKKDYFQYINNSNLQKVYSLYNFYKELKKIFNFNYTHKKEYYLINKNSMLEIRKLYYYDDIKTIIEQIDPNEIKKSIKSKILLKIIKYLPENVFDDLIGEGRKIKMMSKDLFMPEIGPAYNNIINNNSDSIPMIYSNYEIIDPTIAQLFFEDLQTSSGGFLSSFGSKDANLLECVIKEGRIIIKNDKKLYGNKNEIVVIGTINNDNTFISEFVLIYDKYYLSHIYKLENDDLINQLSCIEFHNNFGNIFYNDEKIGIIIQSQIPINNNNNNNNYEPMNIEQQVPYGVTPKDNQSKKENKTNIEKIKFKKKDMDNFPSLSDKEYNLDSIHNVTSIKQYFAYPPLIGLDNIGATCYMNATLQCLCNIEKFVDYFKYNPHLIEVVRNDIGKTQLCSSFKLLIEKLWPDKIDNNRVYNKQGFFPSFNLFEAEGSFNSRTTNKSFPPEDFKTKISKMNSLFEGVAANDAKDLVQFLIMTLHEELNKAKVQNINNAVNNDQRNKQLMFKIFAQDFMISNKSVISDLFYGVNYNITQCGYCNTQSFNYQTYFFLVFPLEEVRIFKSQNNLNYNFNNNYFNSNEVNIYDCFFYDQKINYMTGNNIMYCNFCRQTCNSSMRTFLSTGPEILIIILNRGKGIQFKVKINFSLEIDLSNFIEMKQTGCRYKLIGVITHLGESGMGGHFIAYCKNPISGDWYKYNDSIVSKVENFQTDVIDFAMPYLLFYQKST